MDIQSVFTINGVAIDLANETLRDASGNAIVLRPQCFAVLRHLIENADRLVTKDALMAAVWPDTAVTDDSLVQCIHEIRRALGDEDHAVLKTVPKRGYRLVLPSDTGVGVVSIAAPDDVPGNGPARTAAPRISRQGQLATVAGIVLLLVAAAVAWWLTRGGEAASPDGHPAIAVLPFDNLGDDPEENYFADGITEDLITDLSKISGVLVIARNSVWGYRDKSTDVKRVAEELGVRYVLEGSVRREGDQVRINAQLIDAIEAITSGQIATMAR